MGQEISPNERRKKEEAREAYAHAQVALEGGLHSEYDTLPRLRHPEHGRGEDRRRSSRRAKVAEEANRRSQLLGSWPGGEGPRIQRSRSKSPTCGHRRAARVRSSVTSTWRKTKKDPTAGEYMRRHQAFEEKKLEARAITTGTLGGIIPPQFPGRLVRKGVQGQAGCSATRSTTSPSPRRACELIVRGSPRVPRLACRRPEGSTVPTQDAEETDLSVLVRTISGYVPVSRQAPERGGEYSEEISSSRISSRERDERRSTYQVPPRLRLVRPDPRRVQHVRGRRQLHAGDNTVATLWSQVAKAKAEILTTWGGLGLFPDKIFSHPRRWGQITAYLDRATGARSSATRTCRPRSRLGAMAAEAGSRVRVRRLLPGPARVHGREHPDEPRHEHGRGRDRHRLLGHHPPVGSMDATCAPTPMLLSFSTSRKAPALRCSSVPYTYAAFTAGRYPDATAVIEGFRPRRTWPHSPTPRAQAALPKRRPRLVHPVTKASRSLPTLGRGGGHDGPGRAFPLFLLRLPKEFRCSSNLPFHSRWDHLPKLAPTRFSTSTGSTWARPVPLTASTLSLAANPCSYATGDTPGPVPFNHNYTADSTGTYEPPWSRSRSSAATSWAAGFR